MTGSPYLSLIVPAYNEVRSIRRTLAAVQDYLDPQGHAYEIIVSADGADGTRELVAELAGRVPVGPVNTIADIFADPHVRSRSMLPEIELPGNRPVQIAGQAIKFAGGPPPAYRRPPLLDEHRDEILAEIGLAATEPASLEQP